MDFFRTDGNARVDAVKRVTQLLTSSRASSGDGDALPKSPTANHGKLAIALASGESIDEASKASGLSTRSCERYRYSPALRLVVETLQRQHYDSEIEASSGRIERAVPDAIATLIAASNAGNITAAREILRLNGKSIHDSENKATSTYAIANYMTPNTKIPTPSTVSNDMIPPATVSKAEEQPSPDPEYLRSIEPMWTTQPIKENDDPLLHDK